MVLEEFLYVLLYHCGKFFNRKRGHILGNVRRPNFGLEASKKPQWTVKLINDAFHRAERAGAQRDRREIHRVKRAGAIESNALQSSSQIL